MCKAIGCGVEKGLVRGYCNKHYRRLMAHGSPYANKKKNPLSFKVSDSGCFECTSHKPGTKGYPYAHINKKTTRLNRFVYEEMFGPIPEGLVVRHKCDNRKCINPEHLELGTQKDNVRDMDERGRRKNVEGSRSHHSTIDEKTAISIKRMILLGLAVVEISHITGASQQIVSKIKCGRTWKQVEVGEVVCEE
ncbi:endonuclease [Bacillus phage Slash]|uniref:HNH endonuclease I n=1 Tax=Bacillus phage Slash TaxID=1406790 RepID=U5PX11_9CAUD|nr:endonuclease [Bacillus phage Slash]AGY48321.1 HNH endonuclease I [Bacillus phage Slash]